MTSYVMNMTMTLVWYDTWQLVSAACWTTDDWSVWVFISSTGTGVCPPVSGHTSTSTQTSYCKTHICTLTLREAAAFKHSTYTLTYDTQIVGGGHNQHHDGLSYGFFDPGSWGWAMLTFKSHAIVYEWIKHILYSAYNCANAARRLLHLWEALLWFRWVDAACSGEHWGRCEHWALQSLVSNMGDNFGI